MKRAFLVCAIALTLAFGPAAGAASNPDMGDGTGAEVVTERQLIETAIQAATGEQPVGISVDLPHQVNATVEPSGRDVHFSLRNEVGEQGVETVVVVAWPEAGSDFIAAEVIHGASVALDGAGGVVSVRDLGLAQAVHHSLSSTSSPTSAVEGSSFEAEVTAFAVLCTLTAFDPELVSSVIAGEVLEVCSSPVYIDLDAWIIQGSSVTFGFDYNSDFTTWLTANPAGYCSLTSTFYAFRTKASVIVTNGVDITTASHTSNTEWEKCRR